VDLRARRVRTTTPSLLNWLTYFPVESPARLEERGSKRRPVGSNSRDNTTPGEVKSLFGTHAPNTAAKIQRFVLHILYRSKHVYLREEFYRDPMREARTIFSHRTRVPFPRFVPVRFIVASLGGSNSSR
jgi:hypothetical protein